MSDSFSDHGGFGSSASNSFSGGGGFGGNPRRRRRRRNSSFFGDPDFDFFEEPNPSPSFNSPLGSFQSSQGSPSRRAGRENFNQPFGDPQEGFGSDAFPSFGSGDGTGTFDDGTGPIPPRFFEDKLEDNPSIPFFGALGRFDATPNQRDFFEKDQQRILNQFSGRLDEAIRRGFPEPLFQDYIRDFDFQRDFNERGRGGRSAPIQRVIRR